MSNPQSLRHLGDLRKCRSLSPAGLALLNIILLEFKPAFDSIGWDSEEEFLAAMYELLELGALVLESDGERITLKVEPGLKCLGMVQ